MPERGWPERGWKSQAARRLGSGRLGCLALRRPDGDRRTVDQAELAIDDHLLAGFQAARNHRFAVLRTGDNDRLNLGDVVVLDDEDIGALRTELDGGGRNRQRVGLDAE